MSWRSKTYDELPALSLRGVELRKALRLTTIAWMYGVVWQSFTTGSHVKIFAQMLGFTDRAFGVLTAVPFIATFGQLLAALMIERSGLKKFQFLYCGTIHRMLWIVVGLIPLIMPVPGRLAVASTLVLLLASWFMNSISTPAWYVWMSDMIPKRIRGRYFANRALYSRPFAITSAILLGVVLDVVTVDGAETALNQPLLLKVISVIFILAGLFGMMDVLLFHRVREVMPSGPALAPVAAKRRRGFFYEMLIEPLKDRVFRNYVGFGMTITFAMAVPGWFFWHNAMDNIGLSKLAVNTLFLVISPVLGLMGAKSWGRLIDRWGRRPVLILATLLTMLSVMPWLVVTRHTPAPQFISDWANGLVYHVGLLFGQTGWTAWGPDAPVGGFLVASIGALFGGIAWTGVAFAQTNVMLAFSDGPGRSKYLAASGVLISLGGIFGGLVGGEVAAFFSWMQTHRFGPFLWTNWHITFLLSFILRGLSILWLIKMPDPGAGQVRHMFRTIGEGMSSYVSGWLFWPLRIFGWRREH